MVFNTATVAGVVTPAVIQTFLSHYLNRKRLEQKPTAHISYDEGLHLIRKFLLYASEHTVEDFQRFTAQRVPNPRWVKLDQVDIPVAQIAASADAIQAQLGPHGIERVGGKTWWQWRRPGTQMSGEWIEMRAGFQERKRNNDPGKRVMLYVHGGGYFFGSVDTHRYQLQRHARKLQARIARYRLAPQFPFPCGLHDCLAAYLYLLTIQDPTTIVLAGDSAGGGMILSMLVIMRDQGIPLPAGAILISPWVDLTHSFPSVIGNSDQDYVPSYGFHQRPSAAWPPPTADDMIAIKAAQAKGGAKHAASPQDNEAEAVRGAHVDHNLDPTTGKATASGVSAQDWTFPAPNTIPGPGRFHMIDGKMVQIKDQIQMYTTNDLVSHPLVSPALQPSLGGLPPLLILVGGGEMLRDEQIYLAHKAANPAKYAPGDVFLDEYPEEQRRSQVNKWKPTDVQLQVWDDLCHVVPILSFTRPAKYMYRSIAQFGAWALARAQKTEIEIVDDDAISVISKSDSDSEDRKALEEKNATTDHGQIGKAGDTLPHFTRHMIRQRVDRHGNVTELEPESELPGCTLPASEVGVVKEGPLKIWLATKHRWDTRFASIKRKIQKQRTAEFAKGYHQFGDGENPPPSALAGRRKLDRDMKPEKQKNSIALSLWALWGSKHDEEAIEHQQHADQGPEVAIISPTGDSSAGGMTPVNGVTSPGHSRSRSRRRIVTDEHQTEDDDIDEDTPAAFLHSRLVNGRGTTGGRGLLTPDFLATPTQTPPVDESELRRPKAGGIAFPFSLKQQEGASASMVTLTSAVGVRPAADVRTKGALNSGVDTPRSSYQSCGDDVLVNGAGEGASATRPPMETFFSAVEDLPRASGV